MQFVRSVFVLFPNIERESTFSGNFTALQGGKMCSSGSESHDLRRRFRHQQQISGLQANHPGTKGETKVHFSTRKSFISKCDPFNPFRSMDHLRCSRPANNTASGFWVRDGPTLKTGSLSQGAELLSSTKWHHFKHF